ncbi:MFS transporter [Putridiphycobacter roseus]|uniref:MFS transporter n=1 Tax=Putridiphycobacter roseus TaxID=2219161 RepID=A0A2W1NE51_9FLAO|nr:MFS transporter [Putridiphycobacter roseus]PZE17383.1 MFS transporter [Putridiphycobacter roseus]
MAKNNPVKVHVILLLILAGEAIFALPFVLARVFRPTFLTTFDLSNYELGICFSVYGIVAMFSYLFGGTLADKYSPRILMSVALLSTSIGGFVMAMFPNYFVLKVLYGYFGFTTIYLFWSAMIKATRIWGGQNKQGKAFGFLDGGRGLVAASFGLFGVLLFSYFLMNTATINLDNLTFGERKSAFRNVILIASIFVAFIGILVLLFMRQNSEEIEVDSVENKHQFSVSKILLVMKNKQIWWLMLIVLTAYVGYKITDDFSLYAKEVMLYNEVDAAKIGTLLLFLRPVVGVVVGVVADRKKPLIILQFGFILMIIGSGALATGIVNASLLLLFFVSIFFVAIGVYTLRILYFAILNQANVPIALTGTAVGLVSFIGYTPDVFMGPIMGVLLDDYAGALGHQLVFLMAAIFGVVGWFATYQFNKGIKRPT